MKKLMIIAALLIGSVTTAEAQVLKNLLNKVSSALTSNTTTENTTTTESTTQSVATDVLTGLATSLISEVVGDAVTTTSIVGSWSYSKPAVQFTSEDLLTQAGGAAVASTIEGKLTEGLAKIGLTEGGMTYTFAADSTCTIVVGKRTINGTYTLNSETKEITMKLTSGLLNINIATLTMTLSQNANGIDLVGKADKLLQLIQTTISSSKNSTLSSIGSMVANYDGMMIGFSFVKK